MEQERKPVTAEQTLEIFKRTMPFQVVSDDMLRKIAARSWKADYDAGAVLYDVGDKADDIFIVVSARSSTRSSRG